MFMIERCPMFDRISKFGALAAGLACLLVATPGVAQITNAPREDFWVPDGQINTMVVTNGVAYVGGDFRYVGPDSGGGVGLDLTTGNPVANLPRVEGAVYAVAADGGGGRYIGGLFSMVGGVQRKNLAHILADGSVDTQWHPDAGGFGVNGELEGVHALAVSDNLVYVGGLFTSISGAARNNLAAVDAVTGSAAPWNPSPNDDVLCLDVVREVGVVVAGGKFTFIGGQTRSYLAAVFTGGTGAATTWTPAPNNVVLATARLGETLYVAGAFTGIGQFSRSGIAAVDVYTGFATDWAPQADAAVQALAVTCGNGCAGDGSVCSTVFAAGGFTSIGGLSRTYVAALDPISGAALGWDANISLEISFLGGVSALLAQGDTIYFGGRFSTVGGQPRSGVAAVDTDTARLKPLAPSAGGFVNALQISGNSLYVGGKAVSVGGQPRRSLAAIDTATGRLTDWKPNVNGVVNALAFNNNVIYVGGTFTDVGGLGRNNLAAVGTDGVTTSWNPNANSTVWALAVGASGIYAGGEFFNIGNAYHPGLAFLNFSSGAPFPTGFAIYNFDFQLGYYAAPVFALAVSGNTLYVGGRFAYVGDPVLASQPAVHVGIAALNANTGQDAIPNFPGSFDASQTQIGPVLSLSVFGGALYAGGQFGNIGGAGRNNIAALSPTTGSATTWDPSANGSVITLAPAGGDLYVGGAFSSIGGQSRNHLASVNRTTGAVNSWDPNPSSFVLSLAFTSNQLLVGGDFLFIGPRHHIGLGALPLTGAPVITLQPVGRIVPVGSIVQLSAQAAGNGTPGYQWRFNGTNISGATSSNLTVTSTSVADSGDYDVRVANGFGQAVSLPARVVFYQPAAIVTDPLGQTASPGQPVVLSVGTTGSPVPTFQWRRNGVNIPGQNLATLTLSGSQPADGGSYDVVVSNPGGSVKSQTATVRVITQPLTLTDAFGQGTPYTTASGLGLSSNVGATLENGEPKHDGKTGGKSVWMTWIAPFNGIVTFSTSGSAFDTLLAVYTGTAFATLTPVASDDDRGGFGTSKVKFAAARGQAYAIAVDGLGGTSGDIVLGWQLDGQGSTFIPRIIAQPVSRTGTQNQDVTFSVQASAGQGPSLTYYWLQNCAAIFFATNSTLTVANPGPAQAGAYRVLINNGFFTVLSEPAYLEFGPDIQAVSSDKFEDLIADIPAPSLLQSDGKPRKSGYTSVSAGIPGTQIFNNFGATTQPGEPLIAGVAGGSSRWFTLRPATNGTMIIDTIGSDIDTLLGVYRGPSLFNLTNIVSDNNGAPDGIRSRVVFSALKNVDYYIAIDGVNGQQGNIAMNWKLGFNPAITASLTNQYVTRGNGVTFLSGVSGSAPLYYQWLSNGVAILNATNSSLTLSNVQPANAAGYSLSISNVFGATNTAAATLTVREQMMFSPTNPPSISAGQIQFRVLNILGMNKVVLEASTNLVNWVPIKTNTTPPGNFLDLSDPVLGIRPYRFYRTKEQ